MLIFKERGRGLSEQIPEQLPTIFRSERVFLVLRDLLRPCLREPSLARCASGIRSGLGSDRRREQCSGHAANRTGPVVSVPDSGD